MTEDTMQIDVTMTIEVDGEKKTVALFKTYDAFTGWQDILQDYRKVLGDFYGYELKDKEDADSK